MKDGPSFRFVPTPHGYEVVLIDGAGAAARRERNLTAECRCTYWPTKKLARGWARHFATLQGFPFREAGPPSHAERIEMAADAGRMRVGVLDRRAESCEMDQRLPEAAEAWIQAAMAARDQAKLQPGLAQHFAQAAASRGHRAQTCLLIWKMQLLATPATAGLRLVKSEPIEHEAQSKG